MGNLDRRIAWLELQVGLKPGPRHIIVTNVRSEGCTHELWPNVFLDVLGPPLSDKELADLRAEFEDGEAQS